MESTGQPFDDATLRLIRARRSIRSYLDRPIEPEKLELLLDAALSAPSGGNIQPFSIVAITDAGRRERLAKLVGEQPWVRNAPLVLLFCIDFHRTKLWAESEGAPFDRHRSLTGLLIAYADVYCAAHNAVMAAEAMGLGTVYIGTVLGAITPIRQEFSLPKLVLPVVALCVGYPRRKPARIPKLGRAAAVHCEQYQEPTQAEIRSGYERKYGPISDDYFERTYQEILEIDAQGKKGSVEQVRRIMAKMEIANTAQFLFKLRYRAGAEQLNQPFLDALREAGFGPGQASE